MFAKKFYHLIVLAIICFCGMFPNVSHAAKFKVLVVMSYEENFPWCKEIREGIASALADTCDIKYFYMDTKTNFAGGKEKAKEAYAVYQQFQPDGVIAADDNAQSMFVVPYLKDKVKTPVMFCAVNAEPDKYGYPASNVSGILERPHISESIAFLEQLIPLKTIGFIAKSSETTKGIAEYIQSKADTYTVKFVDFKLVNTMEEAVKKTEELKEQCEGLYIANLEGIPAKDGKPFAKKEIIPALLKIFNKPAITDISKDIQYGILCSVAVTGQEQGGTAAKMLLKAMHGMIVSEIPITQNHKGRRIINVTVMKALGIKPKPEIMRGAKLVRTEE